jgi:DNA integrity scanning protein DisA with diadenylate cyclase activity
VYGEIDHELELVLADYPRIADNWAGHGLDGDSHASPRGLRILARVPRVTPAVAAAIVDHFGDLSKLLRATAAELAQVDGVDDGLAMAVKETLDIIDQYD